MNLKRTIVGSIVVLMLAVSSMAGACDISCGFAQADCHSVQMKASTAAEMEMSGNGMADMAMPPESGAVPSDRASISFSLNMEMRHARLGQMGPCERQSCNDYAAYISRSFRRNAPQFRTALAVARLPRPTVSFYEARDGIARLSPGSRMPLPTTLRI
jgi:hypothetical protein